MEYFENQLNIGDPNEERFKDVLEQKYNFEPFYRKDVYFDHV